MKIRTLVLILLSVVVAPAFGSVTVSAPYNGQSVASPAKFVATSSTGCSKGVASMGIYIDSKLSYTIPETSINTDLPIPSGKHTAVIEEWDKCGGATYTTISNLNVTGGAAVTAGIPSNAVSSGDLLGFGGWSWTHDKGTPGTSTGYSSYKVSSPSLDGSAREYAVSYWSHGGEIYHLTFAHDTAPTHFVYDTYVYLASPGQIANLEMDMNQVMSNGKTVIFGTQCSSYSGSWEFVTVSGNSPHWHPSNIPCNPKSWTPYVWRHIQIASHRDSSGYVTYDWVAVDGKTSYFSGAHGPAALSLGWSPGDLLLNVQLDGAYSGSGSMKLYFDKLYVYRW